MYVGTAEAVIAYFDGLARPIQTQASAGANDIVTQTNYNRVNKPGLFLGPAHQAASHAYGVLARADAAERITKTTYDGDPLLRVSSITHPDTPQAMPSTPATGTGVSSPDRDDPTRP